MAGGGYKGARTGSDGEFHAKPSYLGSNYQGDLNRWWRANQDKTLRQMRIDVVQWVIDAETEIGFSGSTHDAFGEELEHAETPEEESQRFLAPMLKTLADLEADRQIRLEVGPTIVDLLLSEME